MSVWLETWKKRLEDGPQEVLAPVNGKIQRGMAMAIHDDMVGIAWYDGHTWHGDLVDPALVAPVFGTGYEDVVHDLR